MCYRLRQIVLPVVLLVFTHHEGKFYLYKKNFSLNLPCCLAVKTGILLVIFIHDLQAICTEDGVSAEHLETTPHFSKEY